VKTSNLTRQFKFAFASYIITLSSGWIGGGGLNCKRSEKKAAQETRSEAHVKLVTRTGNCHSVTVQTGHDEWLLEQEIRQNSLNMKQGINKFFYYFI
jgi:hypothetical protein